MRNMMSLLGLLTLLSIGCGQAANTADSAAAIPAGAKMIALNLPEMT